MADSKITGLTADTSPTTDDLVVTVNDPGGTPANRKVTIANLLTASTFPNGSVVQAVNTTTSAVATGTTTTPFDDSIPQSSEGDEYMSLAITPKSTTNVLVIRVVGFFSNSAANQRFTMALHQDSAADALSVGHVTEAVATGVNSIVLQHAMAAGTTSATTFKIRCGCNNAGTTTFNGESGARRFGAINKSSIVILEYKA